MRNIKITPACLMVLLFFFSCEKNPTVNDATLPEVTTTNVTNITGTTAICGGTVISDGGAALTACGVCWSTGQTPSVSDNKTTYETGAGSFTSDLTGLTHGTTYYVRAYATNNVGTGYGNAISFTTLNLPVLITAEVNDITSTSAKCGGTISSDGGSTITVCGVCWSTSQTPTVADEKTIDGIVVGSFTSNLTGLTPGTTYYVRAYAINSVGAGYGNEVSFNSEEDTLTITDIDGNRYSIVKIGNQWWMAENLKVTHYRNGDAIQHITDSTEWINTTSGGYCYYDNNTANATPYGSLYNWFSIDDSRNIAPEGWHVPSDDELHFLVDNIGGGAIAGGKMKETGTTHWISPNTGATNESGFSALPGGYRFSSNGYFDYMGYIAAFWTSSEIDSSRAEFRKIYNNDITVSGWFGIKQGGFSVRCVKD